MQAIDEPPERPLPLFLTGPTASGKTRLGLALAERIGAEIISMDSMALYRRLDIGTAKPTVEQRQRVPHYLIDLVEPWQEFSLAEYLRAAEAAASAIRARGKRTLFVGGTPLYLKALLYGVDSGPPPDRLLRARLEQEAAASGSKSLHQRLARVDPQAAGRIHSHDVRRIVRALEVFEKTGRPISAAQIHFHRAPTKTGLVFCLDVPRAELYQRINLRVQQMFESGLIDEVRELLRLEQPLGRTARQALGYKEVIEHLAAGVGVQQTIERVQRRSRQFAKRQCTWFRGLPECRWISAGNAIDPSELSEKIVSSRL
jgi:tRNA dimethylallyltransferase